MQNRQCRPYCVHGRDHCGCVYLNPRCLAGVVVWTCILLSLVLLAGGELPFGTHPWIIYGGGGGSGWELKWNLCWFCWMFSCVTQPPFSDLILHTHTHTHSCWLFILPVLLLPGHDCPLQPVWPQLHDHLSIHQQDRPAEHHFSLLLRDGSAQRVHWLTTPLVPVPGMDMAWHW